MRPPVDLSTVERSVVEDQERPLNEEGERPSGEYIRDPGPQEPRQASCRHGQSNDSQPEPWQELEQQLADREVDLVPVREGTLERLEKARRGRDCNATEG